MKKILALLLVGISFSASANTELLRAMIEMKAHQKMEEKEKADKENYRLVLFYSNKCPYCIKFAPIIKEYASESGLKLEPISLTNQLLPEFPSSTYATQELIDLAYQGKPVVYPALFVANAKTHRIYPVSFGFLEAVALREKMNTLMPKIKEYERKNA